MRVAAFVLVLLVVVGLASAQLNATCFQNDGSVFITPQDGNYNNDRLIFNEKIQREPAAIAYAYNEQQVQDLISCARQSALQSVARSGGHGYEGRKAKGVWIEGDRECFALPLRCCATHVTRMRQMLWV